MKFMREIPDARGKKVLFRTDFDVPVSADGRILESFRIEKQKQALGQLIDGGAIVTMIAHISAIPSFKTLASQLENILGHKINILSGMADKTGQLNLMDNIRAHDGEEKNDSDFAKNIASGFDFYVNNAFAVSHRNHASVSAITQFLPSYAGPVIEEEILNLKKAIDAPTEGKVVVMGGAKTETKVPVIKNFIDKAERIIIGGVIANDILTVRGYTLHASNVDPNSAELLENLNINDPRLILPIDFKYSPDNDKIWDIGPKSVELFSSFIGSAKMVIWNGPVGLFENPDYSLGTKGLSGAIAASDAVKIIGGGDTIEAVNKFGFRDKFNFISTGGGAMLKFLAGEKLPGLEALK